MLLPTRCFRALREKDRLGSGFVQISFWIYQVYKDGLEADVARLAGDGLLFHSLQYESMKTSEGSVWPVGLWETKIEARLHNSSCLYGDPLHTLSM